VFFKRFEYLKRNCGFFFHYTGYRILISIVFVPINFSITIIILAYGWSKNEISKNQSELYHRLYVLIKGKMPFLS